MKSTRKITFPLLCRMALALLLPTALLASCAVDGFEDESMSQTYGVQLTSPIADSITVTPNADGTQMTIAWPVTFGAGGYQISLVNDAQPDEPIVKDSIIDGSKVVLPRVEDQSYTFTILTLGNTELNNTGAQEATTKNISTFSTAYASIPDGTDLTQYFTDNALPDELNSEDKPFDLVPGGHYTITGDLLFHGNRVTLRSTNEANPATITISGESSMTTQAGLTLKNLVFECADATAPIIKLDGEPKDELKDRVAVGKGYYYITEPIRLVNLKVNNLTNEVIDNNKKQYCIQDFIVDNCVFHFNTGSDMSSSTYFNMYNNGGCINNFKATNSTFYNTSSNEMNYFLRYNNSGGPDRTGYSSGSVTLSQCTFYNICKKHQICNYDRMRSRSIVTFTLDRNIIVNSGNKQFARRFIAGGTWTDLSVKNFTQNTYVYDGADAWEMPDKADDTTWTGEASFDRSGTILSGDPGFKDPDNGDFTISGSAQLSNKTGDPRWIK